MKKGAQRWYPGACLAYSLAAACSMQDAQCTLDQETLLLFDGLSSIYYVQLAGSETANYPLAPAGFLHEMLRTLS